MADAPTSAPARPAPDAPRTSRFATLKAANVVVAVILVGFTVWALRGILEPFVLAVFLLLMIDGMARAFSERMPRFPKAAALPVAIVAILALFGLVITLAVQNAGDFLKHSGEYSQRLNAILDQGSQRLGLETSPTVEDLIHRLNPGRYAGEAARAVGHAGEATVFVLIYLGFLLASGRGFQAKIDALFPRRRERGEADRIFRRIRGGVESYLWVQTVVGLIIATASGVLLALFGVQHIFFWCLIVFVANYVPAIGGAVGVLFPAAFALVEADVMWKPVALVIALETVHFFVNHVIQPRMQGDSLNVDPLAVLLALAFWAAIWGVTGAFLSTPLTVVAMAVLAEFPASRAIAILLSGDGRPFPVQSDKTEGPEKDAPAKSAKGATAAASA